MRLPSLQRLLMPPSMINSLPTVNADSSEAKNTTALATSLGLPKRPIGIWLVIAAVRAFVFPESPESLS